MNFDWLFDLFKKKRIDFFVKKDYKEIEKLLKENFKKEKIEGVINLTKPTQIYKLDNETHVCTKKSMECYLKSNLISLGIYKTDKYDCDDFAIHLWSKVKKDYPSLAFGFVLSSKHAFNIFVDNESNIWMIEPQSDKFMTIEQSQKKDLYKNITLIIL